MIFIVEDDDATRDSLRLLLEAEGFDAQEFAAGRPFLDAARPVTGDCLILDVHMPGMSGLEVLEELRRRACRLPSIVVTAQADGTTRARTLAGGALAVLEKPAKVGELLALVRTAVGTAAQPGSKVTEILLSKNHRQIAEARPETVAIDKPDTAASQPGRRIAIEALELL